jgi:ubiquinone/menaquinone biosynthesis C-methylase UbiE
MTATLTFTGERFLPDQAGEMWAEHWHRYHYVQRFVAGKRVLDVACGEGYGSALMARGASSVVGVDISADAVRHATAAYSDVNNLRYVEARCTKIPFADASFDVAVSFETIEHISEHDEFLDEIKRVLTPQGLLIISSPNKAEYSDARNFANEFHVKELYRDELAAQLAKRFQHAKWLSQRNGFYSLITADATQNPISHGRFEPVSPQMADVLTVSKAVPLETTANHAALYFLVLASDDAATINNVAATTSAFTDKEEFAMNDYRKIYRDLVNLAEKHQRLHDALAAKQHEIDELRAELALAESRAPHEVHFAYRANDDNSNSWLRRLTKLFSK